MDNVYLVVEAGGEHEDTWERTVAVHVSEPAAQADIKTRLDNAAKLKVKMNLLADWAKIYEEENPRPDRANRPGAYRQPWPSGLGQHQITDQMRSEREHQKRMEEEEFSEYVRLTREWIEAALVAFNVERAKLGLEPEAVYRPYPWQADTTFSIEEHALIGGKVVPNSDDATAVVVS